MYVRTKVYVGLKMNFRAMLTITKKIKQIVTALIESELKKQNECSNYIHKSYN